jgi:hypothetical protein
MAPGPNVLSSQDDWKVWLNQVKAFASARGVWEYVDPDSANPKRLAEPPAPRYTDIRPSAKSLAELNNDELTRWLLLSTDHNNTMQQYERVRGWLGEVHMEVIHTVSKDNQHYLIGPTGPRDAILRLAAKLAPVHKEPQPAPPSRDTSSLWQELQLNTPKGHLDGWLARWNFVCKKGREEGLAVTQGKKPLLAFLYVVDHIAPRFAWEWDPKVEEDPSIDLPVLLGEFRSWKDQHPDLLSIHVEDSEEDEPVPPTSSPAQNGRVQKSMNKDGAKSPQTAGAAENTSSPLQNDNAPKGKSKMKPKDKLVESPASPAQNGITHSEKPKTHTAKTPAEIPAPFLTQNGDVHSSEPKPQPEKAASGAQKSKRKKSSKKSRFPPAPCLCGIRHFFSDCPYVVEALRPSVWGQDRAIRTKFDEATQNDSNFKELIERAAENGNSKHSGKDLCPIPEGKQVFLSPRELNTAGSGFALIDGNIHVCNDLSRMTNFRPADDHLSVDNGEFRIRGYGTVDV